MEWLQRKKIWFVCTKKLNSAFSFFETNAEAMKVTSGLKREIIFPNLDRRV